MNMMMTAVTAAAMVGIIYNRLHGNFILNYEIWNFILSVILLPLLPELGVSMCCSFSDMALKIQN